MLNKDNKDVLSYMRTAPKGSSSVLVAANMSAQPRRVSIDLKATGIKGSRVADQVAKSRWLRIQSVNHVFALTLTLKPHRTAMRPISHPRVLLVFDRQPAVRTQVDTNLWTNRKVTPAEPVADLCSFRVSAVVWW